MTTLVQGVRIIRTGFQPLGVSGDEVLSRNGVLLEVTVVLLDHGAESPVVDLERWQGECRGSGRVVVGIGRRVPIQTHLGQMFPDGPQVPDVHGRAVVGGHHQPRPVGAECRRSHAAQVGAFESRERAACLDLDQAKDPARVHDDHQAAVGGKTESVAADLPRLAPGADCPEPARRTARHQPLPIGAEDNADAPIDGQLGHLRGIADAPDPGAAHLMIAGRQPFSVRADGDAAAIVERPHLESSDQA